MAAPDGEVLDLAGRPQRLRQFTRDRITVLGFVYTTCVDPEGCPLALRVFDALKRAVDETPGLRRALRLVTLSFDPDHDTPAAMRGYAGDRPGDDGGVPWYFFTTRSRRALQPLLDGFGQDVRSTTERPGRRSRRELSHVLKVFLLDRAGVVREIYSSTFLHPRTVLRTPPTRRAACAPSTDACARRPLLDRREPGRSTGAASLCRRGRRSAAPRSRRSPPSPSRRAAGRWPPPSGPHGLDAERRRACPPNRAPPSEDPGCRR